jgi:DNA-binding phage protein
MSATKVKTKPFDPAEYLDTPKAIAAYLTEVSKPATPRSSPTRSASSPVLAVCPRSSAKPASPPKFEIASLYRSLSTDGNPEFATVMRVAQALGLRLSVTPTKAA